MLRESVLDLKNQSVVLVLSFSAALLVIQPEKATEIVQDKLKTWANIRCKLYLRVRP